MGEEVFTILPFLAVMAFLHSRGTSRRTSILVAWLVTAVWFGAAHLPTYDWNLGQAIIVIGAARLVLTLAFIRTKNLWVSFGAHVLNDWVTFTLVLVGSLGLTRLRAPASRRRGRASTPRRGRRRRARTPCSPSGTDRPVTSGSTCGPSLLTQWHSRAPTSVVISCWNRARSGGSR